MYGVETFTEVVQGAGLHGLCYNIDAVAKQKGANVRQKHKELNGRKTNNPLKEERF